MTILPCSSHRQNWRPRQNDKEVATARKRKPNAATVSPQKKKAKPSKKVIESDSDEENDDDENSLASCGKVLDRDPLDI